MSCDERRDEILLLRAGLLEPDRVERLQSHLVSGCAQCAAHLAEARELELDLALGLEPVEPHPALKAKLLARVGRDAGPRRASLGRRLAVVAAGLVVVAALGVGVARLVTRLPPPGLVVAGGDDQPAAPDDGDAVELASLRESLEETDAELAELEAQLSRLSQERDRLADQLALLRSPDVQVIALVGTPLHPGAAGRLFWQSGEGYYCYLHAAGLTPGLAGRLALWLETEEGDTVLAASFESDDQGGVDVWVELPQETRRLLRAFVTAEPSGVGPRPTGPMVLAPTL